VVRASDHDTEYHRTIPERSRRSEHRLPRRTEDTNAPAVIGRGASPSGSWRSIPTPGRSEKAENHADPHHHIHRHASGRIGAPPRAPHVASSPHVHHERLRDVPGAERRDEHRHVPHLRSATTPPLSRTPTRRPLRTRATSARSDGARRRSSLAAGMLTTYETKRRVFGQRLRITAAPAATTSTPWTETVPAGGLVQEMPCRSTRWG
jgi:hypothetical protein